MTRLHYRDTRGLDSSRPTFTDVLIRGIADGGGLYVPESLPSLSLNEILSLSELPYHSRAARIFELFGLDLEAEQIAELTQSAYGQNFDDISIAPVLEASSGTFLLELWHGPTSAFKDMALQCMPLFFSDAVAGKQAAGELNEDILVLVATSGDTGKAALEGFADLDHVRIAVFYPAEGVSSTQRKQMVTQSGDNVFVSGVHGSFDDCQNSVKAAFNDVSFALELQKRHRLRLSSANSINWGRLLPQIVYYASAYSDITASGGIASGSTLDICVPTGNFGNILSAWYAKRIGVPIDRLICASNANHVLTDFLSSGAYEIAGRSLVKTPAPSMDILISSNLERLLCELSGDTNRVRGWTRELNERGRFEVDPDTFSMLEAEFEADWVSNEDCYAVIRQVYEETGYLLDPHTAVAWEVARRLKRKNPVMVVSTAHWAKFSTDVYKALKEIPYEAQLPPELADLGIIQMLEEILNEIPGQYVPSDLLEIEDLDERFTGIIEGSRESIEGAINDWLA